MDINKEFEKLVEKFEKEASSYIDSKKKEKEKKNYKKKHGRDKFAFAGKSMDRKHSMGIAAEFDPEIDEVTKHECPHCKGKGCEHCDGKGYHIEDEDANPVGEAVNLKKLKKKYLENEDNNYHRENYLLLAKAFGTKAEIKKVEEIIARSEKQGHTSKKDNDWMYKHINPYYNKIRNEETQIKGETMKSLVDTVAQVLLGEDDDKEEPGTQGDKEAYQKKRKEIAKKFGVESCSALDDPAKRKECYNALDKAHVADHEEQVELKKMKKESVGDLSDKDLKTKMKGASTQKETDAACAEMGKRRLKMEKKKVSENDKKPVSKLFAHVRNLMKK